MYNRRTTNPGGGGSLTKFEPTAKSISINLMGFIKKAIAVSFICSALLLLELIQLLIHITSISIPLDRPLGSEEEKDPRQHLIQKQQHVEDEDATTTFVTPLKDNASRNTSGIMAISTTKKDIVEQITRGRPFLTCGDIRNLKIIQQVSNGMNKSMFELKLPGSGVSAIAKRCFKSRRYYQGLLKKETNFLKGLQDQYGTDETIGYFGECEASSDELREEMLKNGETKENIMVNFSIGYTSVVEMGTPLLLKYQLNDTGNSHLCIKASRKCFAGFFTESDVDDLKMIARQYAN